MAYQINGVSIVCSTVCLGVDQRKQQSSTSLAFVRGIHQWLVDGGFPSQRASDAENISIQLMTSSWGKCSSQHVSSLHNMVAAISHTVLPTSFSSMKKRIFSLIMRHYSKWLLRYCGTSRVNCSSLLTFRSCSACNLNHDNVWLTKLGTICTHPFTWTAEFKQWQSVEMSW